MEMTPRVRTFIIATLIWLAFVSLTLLAQVTPQISRGMIRQIEQEIEREIEPEPPPPECFDRQFPAPAPGSERDAWANVLRQDADWLTPATMQDPTAVRMIAEARVPASRREEERQAGRLKQFKARGYNWILFVFSDSDSIYRAVATLRELSQRWEICLTFDVVETPYLNFEKVSTIIEQGAQHCDAIYPMWCEAIGPHWSDDNARGLYADTLARMAREANPNITILGEMYFSPRDGWHVTRPAAAGAMILQNVGMEKFRTEWLVRAARTLTDLPLLGVTVGPRAGYTRRGVGEKQAWIQKKRIEERFRSVEVGTITLYADGAEDNDSLTGEKETQ